MSWLRSVLDAALETTARTSLRLLGRANPGDEDRLLPQSDRDMVLARCHDLRRNNPVAQGAKRALEDNVVGGTVNLQARTSSPAWNAKAEKWLRRWMLRADASGRNTFAGILAECVNARLFDGEILLVPHASGGFALVESERIRPAKGEDLAYGTDDAGRVLWWNVADREFWPIGAGIAFWILMFLYDGKDEENEFGPSPYAKPVPPPETESAPSPEAAAFMNYGDIGQAPAQQPPYNNDFSNIYQ